jgi:hypothetical protein
MFRAFVPIRPILSATRKSTNKESCRKVYDSVIWQHRSN